MYVGIWYKMMYNNDEDSNDVYYDDTEEARKARERERTIELPFVSLSSFIRPLAR